MEKHILSAGRTGILEVVLDNVTMAARIGFKAQDEQPEETYANFLWKVEWLQVHQIRTEERGRAA